MTGGLWITSYVLLWIAVLSLSFAVVALLRQVGVLHARLHPLGVHFAGEGPDLGAVAAPVDGLDYRASDVTLLAFTSPTCEVCAELRPSLAAVQREYHDVQLRVLDLDDHTRPSFDAFNVRSTPYVIAIDRTGTVRVRGVANSLEQVEEVLAEALETPA
jgi:methylamine dehydrogenase accessory protein MauD